MLTTMASQMPPRTRLLPASRLHATMRASTLTSATLIQSRRAGQARSFRFGRWSSCSDFQSSREPRARHQTTRYRYMESISRRLSWDQKPSAEDPKATIKRVMARYWDSSAGKPNAHHAEAEAEADKLKSWSGDLSGSRPGHNIEDVERNAINYLFHGPEATVTQKQSPKAATNQEMRDHMTRRRETKVEEPSQSTEPLASSAEEFVSIDPITNRRIPIEAAAVEASNPSHAPAPKPASDGPQKDFGNQENAAFSTEGKYDFVQWNEPDGLPSITAEERSKRYDDLAKYRSIQWNEPNGLPDMLAEERSKKYDDLGDYGSSVKWKEPDGLRELTAEEKSKIYIDLHKYGSTKWNEPDGLPGITPEEQSKQYEDLDTYGAVRWQEPDGLPKLTAEEKSKLYSDLDKYGAVKWMEPDGFPELTAEEKSKIYSDLDKYGPVRWQEPDGLLELSPEERSKHYEDLHEYGPVRWNEPDCEAPVTSEEVAARLAKLGNVGPMLWNEKGRKRASSGHLYSQYDDLHTYEPVRWNEPDGMPPLTAEEKSKEYEDLGKYQPVRWNEPDGLAPPSAEEKSKRYQDLDEYGKAVRWNEPDGLTRSSAEENSKKYKDVDQYDKPVHWNEPDGLPNSSNEEKSKNYEDLSSYDKPVTWNEPDGLPNALPEDSAKEYKDLNDYEKPVRWNKPDGMAAPSSEELSKKYKDLEDYEKPVRWNEPDGKKDTTEQARLRDLEDGMSSYERSWNSANKAARATVRQSRIKASSEEPAAAYRNLTGHYAKDFPEDFEVSWNAMLSPQPGTQVEGSSGERPEAEIASFDESFPKLEPVLNSLRPESSSKIEPALDRTSSPGTEKPLARVQASADSQATTFSGTKPGTEESKNQATTPMFFRTYGAVNNDDATVAGALASTSPEGQKSKELAQQHTRDNPSEPSRYKILAYDPATQAITAADATSTIQDSSMPLAPPEVLMRLSNPMKFLPHLGPLQAQGYEMVSGGGNVMVFRKVRDAEPGAVDIQSGIVQDESPPVYQTTRINPIDMMGSQPVAPSPYSASPTGYVNYDEGTETQEKPEPPYRTRSQPKGPEQASETKSSPRKISRGKKALIGAASVGGLSYALGVVGEFFKTGSAEVKGPSGRF